MQLVARPGRGPSARGRGAGEGEQVGEGPCLRVSPSGERRQVVAQDRVDGRALLEGADARLAEQIVVDGDGEVRHGAISVARIRCHTATHDTPLVTLAGVTGRYLTVRLCGPPRSASLDDVGGRQGRRGTRGHFLTVVTLP